MDLRRKQTSFKSLNTNCTFDIFPVPKGAKIKDARKKLQKILHIGHFFWCQKGATILAFGDGLEGPLNKEMQDKY